MKKIVLLVSVFLITMVVESQNISKVKLSDKAYGMSKLKKSPKRVFINSFNINYEVYKEAIDVKTGYSGRSGDATARAAVGLSGVLKEDVQAKTDLLYREFVADFKAKGFEIIEVEEASKIESFEGWQTSTGPFVIKSGIPGVLTSVPNGYSFLFKKKSKSGKVKKGAFGGSLKLPYISKQLGDALVVDVNLYFMYSEEANPAFKLPSSISKMAKVKILTNLRLIDQYAVVAPKAKKKIGVFGSIGVKGATTIDYIRSSVNMTYSKIKIGAGAMANYAGGLKDAIEVEGVMKKEKIKAYQKQQTFTPTSFNSYGGLNLQDQFSKNSTWITVDSKKYSEGLYNACSTFLKEHTKKIFKKIE